MKLRPSPTILTALAAVFLLVGCSSKPPLSFGDDSHGNLVWGALHHWGESKDLDRSLVYCDRLEELYGAEAKEMQASLSDFPPTDPEEATYEYGVLNHVGFAAYIKGEVLMEQGNLAGARSAFESAINDYGYAQVKDPNNVWLKPAEMAREKLTALNP